MPSLKPLLGEYKNVPGKKANSDQGENVEYSLSSY